jgi:hypothetical protein
LNPLNFPETNAAIVHNLYPEPDKFPSMIWNTNYQKLATATMFTLFFAGKIYAPKCIINGVNVQDYLQDHYFNCFKEVARKIRDNSLENTVVIGYDCINEPGQGYLSVPHLNEMNKDDTDFKMGTMPTAFQGMLLGSGIPTKVQNWEFKWNGPKKQDDVLVDPGDKVAWLTNTELQEACDTFGWKRDPSWPAGCIWATHGIWDKVTQKLLQPNYFSTEPGAGHVQPWIDHMQNYTSAVREIHADAILFVQHHVLEVPPKLPASLDRLVYAPHWYDGLTLVKKKWCNYNVDFINLNRGKYGTGPLRFVRALRLGEKSIRRCFVDQLRTIQTEGLENIGDYPCILGEIGIPYDMDTENAKAKASSTAFTFNMFYWWSWFTSLFGQHGQVVQSTNVSSIRSSGSSQNRALDANLNALEKNLLNYSLWNYMPDNNDQWGDLWNGEDLSIWQSPIEVTPSKKPSSADLDTVVTSNSSTATVVVSTRESQTRAKKINQLDLDDYLDRMTNSSTDSFQGLLLQHRQQRANVRNLISLHRPHPRITAGIPLGIDFISPTESVHARFEYTMAYKAYCDGPTEIYVPACYFPVPEQDNAVKVEVSIGHWKVHASFEHYWILFWWIEEGDDVEKANLVLEGTVCTPIE